MQDAGLLPPRVREKAPIKVDEIKKMFCQLGDTVWPKITVEILLVPPPSPPPAPGLPPQNK